MSDSRLEIFSSVQLAAPNCIREVSAKGSIVRIDIVRAAHVHGISFHAPSLPLLKSAIDVARSTISQTLRHVGSVTLEKSGAMIEVGACQGRVAIRWKLPDGTTSRCTNLQREELDALDQAHAQAYKHAIAERDAYLKVSA